MTGRVHVISTTYAFSAATIIMDQPIWGDSKALAWTMAIVPVAIGAYLPDIDIQQSRLGNMYPFISRRLTHRGFTHTLVIPTILLVLAYAARFQINLMNIIMAIFVGFLGGQLFNVPIRLHGKGTIERVIAIARGCVGLIVAIVLYAGSYFGMQTSTIALLGLCIGWCGHIFEDMFNEKGCPILWPFWKKRIAIPLLCFVKTRHWTEQLWLFIWIGVWTAWALLATVGRL